MLKIGFNMCRDVKIHNLTFFSGPIPLGQVIFYVGQVDFRNMFATVTHNLLKPQSSYFQGMHCLCPHRCTHEICVAQYFGPVNFFVKISTCSVI